MGQKAELGTDLVTGQSTHIPPIVTVAQVRSGKAGTPPVSMAPVAALM